MLTLFTTFYEKLRKNCTSRKLIELDDTNFRFCQVKNVSHNKMLKLNLVLHNPKLSGVRIYVAPQSRGCCSYFRRPQRPSGRRILFHSLKTSRHPFSLITLTLLHCYVFPKIQYYGNLSFILFVKSRKGTEHSFSLQ